MRNLTLKNLFQLFSCRSLEEVQDQNLNVSRGLGNSCPMNWNHLEVKQNTSDWSTTNPASSDPETSYFYKCIFLFKFFLITSSILGIATHLMRHLNPQFCQIRSSRYLWRENWIWSLRQIDLEYLADWDLGRCPRSVWGEKCYHIFVSSRSSEHVESVMKKKSPSPYSCLLFFLVVDWKSRVQPSWAETELLEWGKKSASCWQAAQAQQLLGTQAVILGKSCSRQQHT